VIVNNIEKANKYRRKYVVKTNWRDLKSRAAKESIARKLDRLRAQEFSEEVAAIGGAT